MNEKIDLVSQPKKSFWKLSIPIIAFCIFDSIYGIVDIIQLQALYSENRKNGWKICQSSNQQMA